MFTVKIETFEKDYVYDVDDLATVTQVNNLIMEKYVESIKAEYEKKLADATNDNDRTEWENDLLGHTSFDNFDNLVNFLEEVQDEDSYKEQIVADAISDAGGDYDSIEEMVEAIDEMKEAFDDIYYIAMDHR